MTRMRLLSSFVALALVAPHASRLLAQDADTRPARYRPIGTPLELGLAGYAKVVCSAVYVSGRDAAEAARNSGHLLMPSERRPRRRSSRSIAIGRSCACRRKGSLAKRSSTAIRAA